VVNQVGAEELSQVFTFQEAQTIPFKCRFHESFDMVGSIFVGTEPAPPQQDEPPQGPPDDEEYGY